MSTMISSSILWGGIDLAAHLPVPDGFDDHRPHAAVVISTPESSGNRRREPGVNGR